MAVPTLYLFDRWDERIGILPTLGTMTHTEELGGEDTLELDCLMAPEKGDPALTTIWMSEGQALPDGAIGTYTFNGCTKLVGGNGTAYSAKQMKGDYLRPDIEGKPGYGTIKVA